MFNSPLLDVAIGLVFIFLLYSLLATSIKEAIATGFGLRARMLKTAIVERMLADTSKDGRWTSILKGFKEFFLEIFKYFTGKREKPESKKKIGDKFYEHPVISNYGSSRIFPTPSYIPTKNFSIVLIDVLKKESDNRVSEIAEYKYNLPSNKSSKADIEKELLYNTDIIKIKELLDYYSQRYNAIVNPIIDRETLQILRMHMHNAIYSFERFSKNIEDWFDDSMNRVSGWYKRQVQVILFILGIVLAITFNVDTIEIAGRLSTDKDARDKMVQLAEQSVDKFKDDPRVRKVVTAKGDVVYDSSDSAVKENKKVFAEYQAKADSIKNFLNTDVQQANDLIALGWGDYGKKNDSVKVINAYLNNRICFLSDSIKNIIPDSEKKNMLAGNSTLPNADTLRKKVLDTIYRTYWLRYKIPYILAKSFGGKKMLGFLLTAFAICLGAPFWFDLLNKLIRLRATGKKEDTNSGSGATTTNITQPISVNVNSDKGEEAVG
ncbi:MAG: hypothetical protein JST75_22420 [Bacteroidetes bacterium]|nr:hypothetical protein [Bacteroidota bacterium]